MKIVKVLGGLGNQMFQYAFAKELEARSGERALLDLSRYEDYALHNGFELERLFNVDFAAADESDIRRLSTQADSIVHRLRRKYLTKRTHYIDKHFGFNPEVFSLPGDRYYDGYWQSEKYFANARDSIRRMYSFALPLGRKNLDLLASMPRPLCSLHVRRGDFLRSKNMNICGEPYYKNAICLIRERLQGGSIIVFSDDIDWCRASIDFSGIPAQFVDWNKGGESWQDMAMMARCDHNIVANSSFSWWGAWLNQNPDKVVVAPSVWNRRQLESKDRYYHFSFDDIVPSGWFRADIR